MPDEEEFDEYNWEEYEKLMEEYEKQEKGFYGYTFFAGSIDTARWYGVGESRKDDSEMYVVLEVSLPEASLLPDDNDCPHCKTWQESLEKINQVKVLGEVTSDYIKRVHFYNTKTNKKNVY